MRDLAGETHTALEDQIASEPRVFAEVLGVTPRLRLDATKPLIFSGIGTSLHAARVAATWVRYLTRGAMRPAAIDAHDLALGEPLQGNEQVVVISHRGYKRFPTEALRRSRASGARTIAIVGRDAPEQQADEVIRTCANESAGTFTVSYIASLAALGGLVSSLDESGEFITGLETVPELLTQALAAPMPGAAAVRADSGEPLMLVGYGIDAITCDEAALKLKEGAWIWAEGMSLEFSLHGTPAVFRPGQVAIVMTPSEDDGGRTESLLSLLATIGVDAITCGSDPRDELFFPPTPTLFRPITGIVPFHRLTLDLARYRGTDPDTLHGNRPAWRTAMAGLQL
jgi:glucosamine--fructose-6-phosphate aminotransferase (isomerizing)